MVERICKICQQTWDFRGGSTLCSEECRTEWVDVLRPRAYRTIVQPHRQRLDLVTRDVEVGKATQEEKHAALENLRRARALHEEFLASPNPRQYLEDLV